MWVNLTKNTRSHFISKSKINECLFFVILEAFIIIIIVDLNIIIIIFYFFAFMTIKHKLSLKLISIMQKYSSLDTRIFFYYYYIIYYYILLLY